MVRIQETYYLRHQRKEKELDVIAESVRKLLAMIGSDKRFRVDRFGSHMAIERVRYTINGTPFVTQRFAVIGIRL